MGHELIHDRRKFIKGAGATVAAVAAASAIPTAAFAAYAADHIDNALPTDAAPASAPADAPSASSDGWDGEYDVVIVGAGMAGVTAAITIANEGEGATCLLIEKEASCAGNSPYSAGDVLYCDEPDKAEVYLQCLIGGATPDDVIHAYATEIKENLNWIISLGATEDQLYLNPPDPTGEKTSEYAEFPNDNYVGYYEFDPEKGDAFHVYYFLFDIMQQHTDVITYMPSTPMQELIQDPETKAILGVVANGKRYKATRGVIMCTGGFENDPEMMFTYTGIQGCIPLAGVSNTGDGHRACMKIGADFWHMHGGARVLDDPARPREHALRLGQAQLHHQEVRHHRRDQRPPLLQRLRWLQPIQRHRAGFRHEPQRWLPPRHHAVRRQLGTPAPPSQGLVHL